jgi:hypothetical protein
LLFSLCGFSQSQFVRIFAKKECPLHKRQLFRPEKLQRQCFHRCLHLFHFYFRPRVLGIKNSADQKVAYVCYDRGTGPAKGSKAAYEGRGFEDCGQRREAAQAVAQSLSGAALAKFGAANIPKSLFLDSVRRLFHHFR